MIARIAAMILTAAASFVLAVSLSACSTTESVKEVMLPLSVVRRIVMDNVPGGLKKQSLNGREITGEYFNALNIDEPSDTARERAKAVIVILGSRRPYVLAVTVTREKKIKGSKKYAKLGEDRQVAKQVVKRLKEALANRPADINVIDEFRAF